MFLSDDVIEILRNKKSMGLEELAIEIKMNKDRIEKFELYLQSMIDDKLLKYNQEKREYHLSKWESG